MPKQSFSHVTSWVFDLDNTLYPPSMGLFPQIERRMTDWVMQTLHLSRAEADHLRATYWQTYGTTLSGLMRDHGVDPVPYLAYVHDIDFSVLLGSSRILLLRQVRESLAGRAFLYDLWPLMLSELITKAERFALGPPALTRSVVEAP